MGDGDLFLRFLIDEDAKRAGTKNCLHGSVSEETDDVCEKLKSSARLRRLRQ